MADKIASNSVVLEHLSEQINNRRFLYNLCLVSRGFHAVFIKQLYKCIRLDSHNARLFLNRAKRQLIIQNDKLIYTNILIIAGSADEAFTTYDDDSSSEDDEDSDGDEESTGEADEAAMQDDDDEFEGYDQYERKYLRLNRCVLDLIQNCPNLRSYASTVFPLDHNCMKALANLHKLDRLSLQFPEDEVQDDDIETYVPEDIDQTIFQGQGELQRLVGYTTFGQDIYLPRFTNLRKLSLLKIRGDPGIWRTGILQIFLQSPELHHLSLSKGEDPSASDGDSLDMEPWYSLFEWICQQYHATLGKPVSLKTIHIGYCFRLPDPFIFHGIMDTQSLERLSMTLFSDDSTQWELLCRILSPSITPNLKQLSCGYVKDWEKLRAVITDERAGLGFHATWTINFQIDDKGQPHFLLDPCSDKRLACLSFRLCPKYTEYPALEHLKHCNWITHISIDVEDSFGASYEHKFPNSLPFIHQIVAKLPNLQALWVMYGWSRIFTYHRAKVIEDVRDAARQIFGASTTLRYLRLGRVAWRAHRSAGVLTLEELDEWEDEVEGPEIFHVPSPVQWSYRMDHFDW